MQHVEESTSVFFIYYVNVISQNDKIEICETKSDKKKFETKLKSHINIRDKKDTFTHENNVQMA